ncbi:MAG: hypothetical protein LBI48_13130 [Burkholderiaceae bacterium]|jgi:hypothetical protein|nr:hypothetical protein [Burkholderiaceae bacterium]
MLIETNHGLPPVFAEIFNGFATIPRQAARSRIAMDEREARENYIEERTEELMSVGGPFDPWDFGNLQEALAQSSDEDLAALRDLLRSGQFDAAGRRILNQIMGYWHPIAVQRTRESVEANWSVESGWTAPRED